MPFVNVIQAAASSTTDWDTHQVGAFLIPRLDTGGFSRDFDHQFPLDSAYIAVGRMNTNSAATAPYNYAPNGDYGNPANQVKAPPYAAVWVSSETAAISGYGRPDAGWRVYKRNGYSDGTAEGGTPTSAGRAVYIAHAWKSGVDNDDGYIGIGGSDTFPFFVVSLDDYSGTTGSGGTDSWTDPFDWSSPKYSATATLVSASGGTRFNLSSLSETVGSGLFYPNGYQPFRSSSNHLNFLFRVNTGNSGSFSSASDCFDKTKLQHFRIRNTTSGSEYDMWDPASGTGADQYTKIMFQDSSGNEPPTSGNLFYIRWYYNTGDAATTFAKFSAGNTIQIDLYYTDDT
ncbi:MAG: hypothetical protein CMJ28_06725 [Phycisphaerae bacterium]|nr:hypothetical protein [Phycisphaerae bacterium]